MAWRPPHSTPARILTVFILVVVGAVIIAASTSATSFGVYNGGWDGTSNLQTQAEKTGASTTIARKTTAYTEIQPDTTISIILSPDRSYTDSERTRLQQFVKQGGTLVIAGDFNPHANPLLRSLGAETRLDGRLLRDERYNYKSPAMPRARNVSTHPLVANTSGLTLNHGTVVRPGNATVLVNSSAYAYLDSNQNSDLDTQETAQNWAVATSESVGDGRVIVVSDASIFINAMIDQSGNHAFVTNLVAQSDHVLLDYSHTASLPPLMVAMLIIRQSAVLQLLGGLLIITGLYTVMRRPVLPTIREYLQSRHEQSRQSLTLAEADTDELANYLAQRYPDWDANRIERVVAAVRDRKR